MFRMETLPLMLYSLGVRFGLRTRLWPGPCGSHFGNFATKRETANSMVVPELFFKTQRNIFVDGPFSTQRAGQEQQARSARRRTPIQ